MISTCLIQIEFTRNIDFAWIAFLNVSVCVCVYVTNTYWIRLLSPEESIPNFSFNSLKDRETLFLKVTLNLQLVWVHCSTHANVRWEYILLEAIPCQLFIYIWHQARNWIGLPRSSLPWFWGCSISPSECATKPGADGPRNRRLHSIHWTPSPGFTCGKII